eukprot:scaffold2830_cov131-Cylindrotheca_fusiformis.AAC.77
MKVILLLLTAPILFYQAFSFENSHPASGLPLRKRTRPEPSSSAADSSTNSLSRTKWPQTNSPISGYASSTKFSVNAQMESEPSAGIAASYHLLWTRGFFTKFLLSTVGLTVGHHLVKITTGVPNVSCAFRGWLSSLGLSLLASSCCLLQILANVFAGTVGCLGLNTALGPSRPYWLSLLFFLTFINSSTSLPQIVFRLGIAFLPEMLHTWNKRHTFLNRRINPNGSGTTTVLEFDVPTMGCVACINKIDSTLRNRRDEKLLDVTSWLDPSLPKGGATKVTLAVESRKEAAEIGQALVKTLDSIGFGGSSLSKVEVLEQDDVHKASV